MPKDFDREGDVDSATAGGQGAVSVGVVPEGVAAMIGRGRGKLDHFKKTTLARLDEEEEHESYAVAAAWERFGESMRRHLPPELAPFALPQTSETFPPQEIVCVLLIIPGAVPIEVPFQRDEMRDWKPLGHFTVSSMEVELNGLGLASVVEGWGDPQKCFVTEDLEMALAEAAERGAGRAEAEARAHAANEQLLLRFGESLVKRDEGVSQLPDVLQTSDALAGFVTAVVDDRLAQFFRTFIEVFGFRINPDADQ